MIVKICGLTRAEDAALAASLGATAVGLIFWPGSPRAVGPAQARAVMAAVPEGVLTVGVFVDPSRAELDAVLEQVPLGAIQLHGREPAAFVESLPWRVIKAVPLPDAGPLPDLARWPPAVQVLLDADDPVKRGGTGAAIDWRRAAMLAAERPVILAGGLRADNVGDAIRQVRPAGIDVSSGVEATPGVKDASKLRALFDALRDLEA